MAVVTLGQLRDRAKSRSDMAASGFVSDVEWGYFLNASADELYDILIQKFGEGWAFATINTATVAGVPTILLPANFYRLIAIELLLNGQWIPLVRHQLSGLTASIVDTGRPREQFLAQGNIVLRPTPDAAYTVRVSYVPTRALMVVDADTLDGVSGWEEYVVVDAAIKALNKEESDSSALNYEKAALLSRIESAAERRDEGQPRRVVDVEQQGLSELDRHSVWWE